MATNLNPGADATLVSIAYRAAMADTPGDYSRTFEKAAESYGRTMKASSEMWGNVAKLGAQIGGEMIANAKELSTYAAAGAGLDSEGAQFLSDEVYANKDAQRELGLLPNIFGDRETKQKLAALKMDQKNLFADIDSAVESVRLGTEAVGAGLFDENIAGLKNSEMVNAIIKSNLKDKVTKNKNIARLSRDEKTGELMYTLYNTENNPDGEVLMGDDGKPQTMTIKQFNESIATNVKDTKNVVGTNLNKRNDTIANDGAKSVDGVYDPQMKQRDLNYLDTMLETPTDLKRAMHTTFGYSNTSFYDDIQNPSTLSADLYNTLLTATGGGDVLTGGITDNMVDTDGEAGISQAELQNTDNYNILSANILGLTDPEVSKAYFKEYTAKKFEEAYTYGYSKKPPATSTSSGRRRTGTRTTKTPSGKTWLGSNKALPVFGGNRYAPYGTGVIMLNSMEDATTGKATSFNLFNVKYEYNPKEDNWSGGGQDFGTTDKFVRSMGLKGTSDFANLTSSSDDGGGGEIVQKDLSSFFGSKANEENTVIKLKEMYPGREISAPINPREKIYVDGEAFYLRGKGNSTPEMEMERLQKKLQGNIDYYNQIDE